MNEAADAPVLREFAIRVSGDHAFAAFTEDIAKWWPNAFSASGANLASVVIEPMEGGRVYEVDTQGKEYDWGSVTIWEPGRGVVLTWTLGIGSTTATEVEASFSGDADGCLLRLEHRGAGADWAADRPKFDSSGGWDVVLGAYRSYAETGQ